MAEKKRAASEFQAAAQNLGLSEFVIRDCSMCGYTLRYLFRGTNIYYDSGCYCVDYGPDVQERTWEDLAEFYNMQTSAKIIEDVDKVFGFTSLQSPEG